MTTYTSSYNTLNYIVLPLATDFFVMNTIPLHKKVKLAPLPVPQELVRMNPFQTHQEERMDNLNPLMKKINTPYEF